MSDRAERVWIELPLTIDATVALCRGIQDVWPDAQVLTEHERDDSWLCIELSGPKVGGDVAGGDAWS